MLLEIPVFNIKNTRSDTRKLMCVYNQSVFVWDDIITIAYIDAVLFKI